MAWGGFHSICHHSYISDILTSVFAREGKSAYIVTDNGSQFCSLTFQDFMKDNGITHIRTSVYHAQANGAVERFNRVLKN